ncbi:hypothetical protein ALO95_102001 [Pseudomonas syringae pv. antirrhini]|uniref:Uncharacterized protein n=1 Tax=Pseudomonas syringae pv. antirrhini TaxID=251702 RepID=A0A0P9JFD5_9PSED|nr:hypothetical protein ALO88_102393 [Pseudomonas syringae pv. antirrhini]RMP33039.1 hypothetical protein ALQ24_102473 [Pseudomonas syringae pv. antirrhini]RMP35383.1 hypothetical protein ALQ23_102189 [Pseudomonas syringae pv. antirrhini]RMW28430.1 hypothetical protein ALO95_102001 [Pseudomonas syringae pv. antirrhini]
MLLTLWSSLVMPGPFFEIKFNKSDTRSIQIFDAMMMAI